MTCARLFLFFSICYLVVSAFVPPVLAETKAKSGEIEEIVVTAQKREQALLKVPLSVQAISGVALESAGIREVNDLIDLIPGASSVGRTAPGRETIQIRGISSGSTGDATVGYYVDDVAFGIPNLQIAPPARFFDLKRIEVLRGPQGTLYGQGAMGGTIRYITPQANNEIFQGRGQVEGSDTDGGGTNYALDAMLNVPLVKDKAALRVSGGYEFLSGFAESPEFPNQKNINDQKSWNVRGKLGFTPTQTVSIDLGVWFVKNNMDFTNRFSSIKPPIISGTGGKLPFGNLSRIALYSAAITIDLPFGSLVSSSAYIDHKLDFTQTTTFGIVGVDDTFKTNSFTQEVRLLSDGAGPANWLLGGYFNDTKSDSDLLITVFGSPFLNSLGTIKTTAWAIFGEASYAFFDQRLTALVGGRYFQDDRRAQALDRNTMVLGPRSGTVYKTFNPRFNLSFDATDRVLLYANMAKGFRSGSFQSAAQAAAAQLDGIPTSPVITPDKVWSYELGAKGKFFGGRVILDATFYYLEWKKIQLQFTTSSAVIALANGGDARIPGLDLGVTWVTPLEGLTLQLVGNVNDAKFHRVEPAIAASLAAIGKGNRIPNVPKNNARITASYVTSVSNWNADFFMNGSYVYRAKQIDATSNRQSDKINKLSLRLGLKTERWKITLFGENLANKAAAVVIRKNDRFPLYPRRIGVTVSSSF
jgi:outer membrane receptor protein involved in Fe transport